MDNQTALGLVNLGLAGIGLYLFLTGKLRSGAVVDADKAEANRITEERLAEKDEEIAAWKRLALGSERRLDTAVPVVAHAIGAPIPTGLEPAPPEART